MRVGTAGFDVGQKNSVIDQKTIRYQMKKPKRETHRKMCNLIFFRRDDPT